MQQEIEKYLSGNMDVADRKVFLKRLEEDAEWREEFIRMKNLQALLVLSEQEGDESFARPRLEAFERRVKVRRRRWHIAGVMRYAALIALLLVGAWQVVLHYEARREPIRYTEVEVPKGQCVHLTLADGSKVWLSPLSKMRIPSRMDDGERSVELDGEGYFQVAHDEKHPFTVKTGQYNIQVLGTEFYVFAYARQADKFETCLVSGKVKVYNARNRSESVYLHPDEKVQLLNHRLVKFDSDFAGTEYLQQGIFCFSMKSLDEILGYLSLWYDTRFIVQEGVDKDKRISGKFRQNSEVTLVLDALKEIYGFRYASKDDHTYVIYK